jgi:hypothetical protein
VTRTCTNSSAPVGSMSNDNDEVTWLTFGVDRDYDPGGAALLRWVAVAPGGDVDCERR